jgi:hypothetical protein
MYVCGVGGNAVTEFSLSLSLSLTLSLYSAKRRRSWRKYVKIN